ncbi:hypothetical protein RhiirA1_395630 [Rhizophagus irregularis]|uniref:Uncharacterized protein n=1 Tax=Rhizophagus irregularis TaxID=588596 RepID=A0A2N0RNX9_9GLOM|nr:hypothetical protein RhiirA1_395630 [Rhizophagus irregularis]
MSGNFPCVRKTFGNGHVLEHFPDARFWTNSGQILECQENVWNLNVSFLDLDELDFCRGMLASWFWMKRPFRERRILGFGRNGFEKSKIMYPSATETLTKFREDSALINGTRLENKVPVPIPKLLVQDQDLWNAGFRNWTNQTFDEEH